MADLPANEDDLQQDQAALRRKARRRLVGAVALALSAVLLVPMLFDSDPRPLGSDVDVRIPSPDTPFAPAPVSAPAPASVTPVPAPETVAPPPQPAEPTAVPSVAAAGTPAAKATPTDPPLEKEKTAEKPPRNQARQAEKAADKPTEKQAEKQAEKPAEKPVAKKTEKVAEKPAVHAQEKTRDAPAQASASVRRYFIQLGVFGNEGNANILLDRVKEAGFKGSLANGAGQFKVRVGPFSERDKAVEAANKLKSKGFSAVIIAS